MADRGDQIIHLVLIFVGLGIFVWGIHYRWGLKNDKRKR